MGSAYWVKSEYFGGLCRGGVCACTACAQIVRKLHTCVGVQLGVWGSGCWAMWVHVGSMWIYVVAWCVVLEAIEFIIELIGVVVGGPFFICFNRPKPI